MTDEQSPSGQVLASDSNPVQERSETPPGPSFGRRAVRWIFRMLAAVLLGAALGAGVFYGARKFYRDAIEPLQTLDQRMITLETGLSDLNSELRESERTRAEEISELKAKVADQAEELAVLSAQVSQMEFLVEGQDTAIAELQELRGDVEGVQQDLTETNERLAAMGDLIQAGELPVERVEETLQLVRVMSLLTRTRLWMEQDNYGLASEDLASALDIMQVLVPDPGTILDERDERLAEIADRIGRALEATRTNPTVAEEESEIAWKLLVEISAP